MNRIREFYHRASADFLLASEEVITRAVGLKISPPTIRINVFDPPAILIGYNQDIYEEINLDEAVKLGFNINRRPTGGGTIIMYSNTPGWEIWLPSSMINTISIDQIYQELIKIPLTALRYLGIENARQRGKNDIEVKGRKISGTGLYMDSNGIMLCGTILLDFDVKLMLRVLKLPIEKISDKDIKTFEERIITVKEVLGFKPSVEDVRNAFRKAVAEVFKTDVVEGHLNEWELKEMQSVIERYRSSEWIYSYRSTNNKSSTKICINKTSAGLIRIHVKVFEGVVEQILITGDFFAYPQGSIQELEANLKWISIEDVYHVVTEFRDKMTIHGISIYELANLIKNCIEKR